MNRLPCIDYMYENEYKTQLAKLILEDYENKNRIKMNEFSDCYILPVKFVSGMKNPSWGLGGILKDSNIIPESIIEGAFGGYYEFNKNLCNEIEDTIIHIPIVKDHWGHFLIDVLCRFWFLALPEYKNFTITCCVDLKTPTISGNFLRVFELLGITNRLRVIAAPTHCKKLLIPDYSLGFNRNWSNKYLDVIKTLLVKAPLSNDYKRKKVYFIRTKFLKSRVFEIGEKQIENAFKKIGFEILSPEKMSIEEQISCFQGADEIVSLSGTIPHNIVFAHNGLAFTILNRQPAILLPQLRINQMMGHVQVNYVDVWHPAMQRNPKPYGKGGVWVYISHELSDYFYDKYNVKVKTTNSLILFLQRLHWYAVRLFDYIWSKR